MQDQIMQVPQARLRVSAQYAATDGRTPETVDVEYNGDDAGPEFIAEVVRSLAGVATGRYVVDFSGPAAPAHGLAGGDFTWPAPDGHRMHLSEPTAAPTVTVTT